MTAAQINSSDRRRHLPVSVLSHCIIAIECSESFVGASQLMFTLCVKPVSQPQTAAAHLGSEDGDNSYSHPLHVLILVVTQPLHDQLGSFEPEQINVIIDSHNTVWHLYLSTRQHTTSLNKAFIWIFSSKMICLSHE